jgi:N-dimethylarginine dimethylaminohydrolase
MVKPVSVHNEWDPLEEVIVGTAMGARIPSPDRSVLAVEPTLATETPGEFPRHVLEETEQALGEFVSVLVSSGVRVRRPPPATTGIYNYCPRDVLLSIGNSIIEAPMVLRARSEESTAYREILIDYMNRGCPWIAAPKQQRPDGLYNLDDPSELALLNVEPAFDAANILRVGRDIVYQVSSSGNLLGATWLQSVLGPEYRVDAVEGLYPYAHIDTTISVLRPGLVLVNPSRVAADNLPAVFKGWDVLQCPDPDDHGPVGGFGSSKWLAMNLLMINPTLAVVDSTQPRLVSLLETHGIDVVPLSLPHPRLLGGGFHCVTLDVRRSGSLVDYRS